MFEAMWTITHRPKALEIWWRHHQMRNVVYFLINKKQVPWHLKFYLALRRHGDITLPGEISNAKIPVSCLSENTRFLHLVLVPLTLYSAMGRWVLVEITSKPPQWFSWSLRSCLWNEQSKKSPSTASSLRKQRSRDCIYKPSFVNVEMDVTSSFWHEVL